MAATFDDVFNSRRRTLSQDRQLPYSSIFGVLCSPICHIIWPLENPTKDDIAIQLSVESYFAIALVLHCFAF